MDRYNNDNIVYYLEDFKKSSIFRALLERETLNELYKEQLKGSFIETDFEPELGINQEINFSLECDIVRPTESISINIFVHNISTDGKAIPFDEVLIQLAGNLFVALTMQIGGLNNRPSMKSTGGAGERRVWLAAFKSNIVLLFELKGMGSGDNFGLELCSLFMLNRLYKEFFGPNTKIYLGDSAGSMSFHITPKMNR